MDKVTTILVTALKQALTDPVEQRLYRSGKLSGLFAGRGGANGDAAAQALRDGLLEIVRTETKGKTVIDWARLTPRGVDFLHDHESPVQALHDLHEALRLTQEGVPAWFADLHAGLQTLGARLTEEVQKVMHRLDSLSQRVEDSLQRLEEAPRLSDSLAATVPWAAEALGYLDRRKAAQANGPCPLPELFASLIDRHTDLSMTAFHDGLRRLRDAKTLKLLPFTAPPAEMNLPEYALLEGATFLYFATR